MGYALARKRVYPALANAGKTDRIGSIRLCFNEIKPGEA